MLPLAVWMVYLQVRLHNALGFLSSQKQWGHHPSLPWEPIAASIGSLFNLTMFDASHGLVALMDLVSTILLLAMTVYLFRLRRSYGFFCVLVLLILSTTGQMDSMSRHVLVAFPAFIAAGVVLSRRPGVERAVLVCAAPTMTYLVSRFVTGQWAG